MTSDFDPTPRPALRKAADSDVHPTTYTNTSTGDSVLDGKTVEIRAKVPKKLRKQMKAQAKEIGISTDEFVTRALAAELQRRKR